MLPLKFSNIPAKSLNIVVLPLPDSPIIPYFLPNSKCIFKFDKIFFCSLYAKERSFNSISFLKDGALSSFELSILRLSNLLNIIFTDFIFTIRPVRSDKAFES